MLAHLKRLPKVELHAHLNGSVRPTTLIELSKLQGVADVTAEIADTLSNPGRSLAECFKIFDVIHKIIDNPAAVRRIAREAVEDAAEDNVVYMELRTTPRAVPASGMTVDSYVESVLGGIDEALAAGANVLVRLLLSINRTEPLDKAMTTVRQAASLRDAGKPIVGIDFSGNPMRGLFIDFRPAFDLARSLGLKSAVHCAEVMNVKDTVSVLDFGPDRLGHMCVVGAPTVKTLLKDKSIPIELCPTSNELTLHLPALHHHPTLAPWIEHDYPFSICTDDSGVFNVTLSSEYLKVAESFELGLPQMAKLAVTAAQYTFLDDAEKAALAARMEAQAAEVLSDAGAVAK